MNDSQAKELGRLITSERTQQGLSIRDIERHTGIPLAWLARVEAGRYQRPGTDRVFTVTERLGIDPDKVNQVTGGYLASRLPSVRTYFRAKHGTRHDRIDEIEKLVDSDGRKEPQD